MGRILTVRPSATVQRPSRSRPFVRVRGERWFSQTNRPAVAPKRALTLVESDTYLPESTRYVVLNPVRAGMTADAADWRWSSYAAMIGAVPAPSWLTTDWLLSQFGHERNVARLHYV